MKQELASELADQVRNRANDHRFKDHRLVRHKDGKATIFFRESDETWARRLRARFDPKTGIEVEIFLRNRYQRPLNFARVGNAEPLMEAGAHIADWIEENLSTYRNVR